MTNLKTMLCSTAVATALTLGAASAGLAGGHLDATDDVYWLLELTLAEGQDEVFNTLMGEMVMATRKEAGALAYEWHRDGDTVHIYERYDTNADAGIHMQGFGENFAERFLAILEPTKLTVYGPAEGGVREGLSGFGAAFVPQVGGFAR